MSGSSVRVRRALAAVRWGGAITATLALAALVAIGPPSAPARAAASDSYNQMTGIGNTASAIKVSWTQGLLNDQNQPISAPGSELAPNADRANGTGPLSFMYSDFKTLQVTVSQTQNITHQGITIKWTGGQRTNKNISPQSDFLEMMECYGDASTGPSPEDCEYGSENMLLTGQSQGVPNAQIETRDGYICPAGSQPSSKNPPAPPAAPDPAFGCDTKEPAPDSLPHCEPNAPVGLGCSDSFFEIPFRPVDDPAHPIYEEQNLPTYFSEFNTNEVQEAITNDNGTGEDQFETLTRVEAPGLGCGELESDGKPRDCWLVVVPRGTVEPNGYLPQGTASPAGFIDSSPLSASNWAQRIQIHLGYAPLGTACPPDVLPTLVVGTQLISRAVSSWEFPLNTAAKCNRVYSFTATTEATSTQQLQTQQIGNAGMAFTTIPIGAEATRYPGGHPPGLPSIVYAPVAVTALDVGFDINEGTGYDTTPVNLTPNLLAKMVTQVYRYDLPDYAPSVRSTLLGPAWSQQNPENFTKDQDFKNINSAVTTYPGAIPIAPLLTLDHSALNQQVWQWMQTDPVTASWLDGTPDKSDPVTADPDYVKLKLGKAPAPDSWPEAYKGVRDLGPCPITVCEQENPKDPREEILRSQDLLQEQPDFDTAASLVLAANDPSQGGNFTDTNKASDGTPGWWSTQGVLPIGQVFMSSLGDMSDLAAYGLISAALCKPGGHGCVTPTIASATKALNSAKKDTKGLLQVNPATVPAGGYPLVQVVYAAVPTRQSTAALNAYADLIAYAAGKGQTVGSAPGDLPPGYLPLPAGLKKQAQATVTELRAIASPPKHTPSPTHTGGSPGSGTSSGPGPGSGTGSGSGPGSGSGTGSGTGTGTTSTPTPTVGASATPTGNQAGSPAGAPSPQGPVTLSPTASLVAGTTQKNSPGAIRWALVAVLIIGTAGGLGGGLLRSGRMPRWRPRRART